MPTLRLSPALPPIAIKRDRGRPPRGEELDTKKWINRFHLESQRRFIADLVRYNKHLGLTRNGGAFEWVHKFALKRMGFRAAHSARAVEEAYYRYYKKINKFKG